MRVGLIIYNSLETVSGGYLYDRQLVHTLRSAGDDVEIITLPGSHYGRHILHNVRPSLARRLRFGRYDILLQDELNHPSLFLINEQLRGRVAYPIVSIVHHLRASERHPQQEMPTYRRLERRYLRSVDGFVFNSATTRSVVESIAGESRPRIVAYPAADHIKVALSERQVSDRVRCRRPIRLLFAGNLIPRKGVHILLAALAQIPVDAWELAVVGDATLNKAYAASLREQISRLPMEAKIRWHGRLADEALWDVMAQSDLLVVPSSYEGFGIVYLEGMAFGLPAVATTAGAAAEIITGGENGFLIAPDGVGELVQRLHQIMGDRQLLGRMSLAALKRFHTFPTWSTSMMAVRRFLLQMHGGGI